MFSVLKRYLPALMVFALLSCGNPVDKLINRYEDILVKWEKKPTLSESDVMSINMELRKIGIGQHGPTGPEWMNATPEQQKRFSALQARYMRLEEKTSDTDN